jgi:hypothetical protein
VRRLAFQPCTAGAGGFVCPFSVTFEWNDPAGTGGTIAWHLGGRVVSRTNNCTPVPFAVPETTNVPPEQAGAHTATITGTLTVSSDPAAPGTQTPSTASASLDAGGGSAGPVSFFGGSTC